MSRRDVNVFLQHMLEHAQKAVELSQNRKRSNLDEDLIFNLALTRLIEIIGEAANRVPEEFQKFTLKFHGWKSLECETD